jgi:ABC-type lipoprotein release transport system permease subunit
MFRISGMYQFNVQEMDKGMVFVRLPVAQEMLAIDGEAHEIALTLTSDAIGRDSHHPIWSKYSSDNNEAVGWTVLLPQLKTALEMSQFATLLIGIILFGVVSLGIINTLFMSLHERMFEFGVLRAVGTRPRAMAGLVILEASALAVLSIIVGLLIGTISIAIVAQSGIDYTGIEFVGVTFREPLYPVMQLNQFTVYPALVFLFTITMGLFPALYAARMKPANAMRLSM